MTAPLWLLTLITFSGTLAMHIFVPALPEAARALGASIGEMQLTMSVYILGLAVGQLAYGPLSDRYGRRPVLMAGLALYTAGRPRRLLRRRCAHLIVARLLQALGGCAGMVIGRAMVRDTAGPQDAARRLATMNLMVVLGPGLAPLLGGALATAFGWRSIFYVLSALGVLNLVFALWLLPESHGAQAAREGRRPRPQLRQAPDLAGVPGLRDRRRLRHDLDVRLHQRLALHLRPPARPAGLRGRHLSGDPDGRCLARQHGRHAADPAPADRPAGGRGRTW